MSFLNQHIQSLQPQTNNTMKPKKKPSASAIKCSKVPRPLRNLRRKKSPRIFLKSPSSGDETHTRCPIKIQKPLNPKVTFDTGGYKQTITINEAKEAGPKALPPDGYYLQSPSTTTEEFLNSRLRVSPQTGTPSPISSTSISLPPSSKNSISPLARGFNPSGRYYSSGSTSSFNKSPLNSIPKGSSILRHNDAAIADADLKSVYEKAQETIRILSPNPEPEKCNVVTERDSGQGDLEDELQFSSSSPSLFDPKSTSGEESSLTTASSGEISNSKSNCSSNSSSDSVSYSYTCTNSCCTTTGSDYDDEDEDDAVGESRQSRSKSRSPSILQEESEGMLSLLEEVRGSSPPPENSELDQELEATNRKFQTYLRRVEKLKKTLQTWDGFLQQNGISRPDFFCKYKEREQLRQIVEEFQQITTKHREGLVVSLENSRSKVIPESDANSKNDGSKFNKSGLSPETSSGSSGTKIRRNSWRNKRIRKLLSAGTGLEDSSGHGEDASSSNEAAHLEQKLKNLSSELVTLRNRLHVNGQPAPLEITHGNGPLPLSSQAGPIIPPHQTNSTSHQQSNYPNKPLPPHPIQHHLTLSNNINDGPHPPQSYLSSSNNNNNNNNIHSNNNHLANNHINNNNNNNHPNTHGSVSANAHGNNGALNSHQNGIYQQGYYVNQSFQKDVMGLSSSGGGSGAVVGVSNCSSTTSSPCSGDKLTSSKLIERVDVVAGISSLNLVNNNNGSNGGSRTSTGNGHQHSSSNQNSSASNVGSNGGNSFTGGVTTSAGSVIVGSPTGTNTNSGGDATPSESSFKLSSKSAPETRRVNLSDIEDLIHLPGPLTEDALIRCLQARCSSGKYSVYMGPILLMTNRLRSLGNPMTLASTADVVPSPSVRKVVAEALRQQGDTGYPQAIILSGASGSGKTYTSMLILRQLFQLAGGGVETDAFKHLAASITVLRSLGTARTPLNRDSSRVGHFIEVQVTDGTVYRTKVHCYFLDQTRVVKRAVDENNYHIFYQMLAGLSHEERERLHLGEQSVDTLCYLSNHRGLDPEQDAKRFMEWKASLSMLGIPFLDVVRVLAAVLLVGNVNFKEAPSSMEIKVEGETELQAAAGLLGVSETALKQGLTMRTQNIRNQLVRSRCDANLSNYSRDALAKSLYCRTVATIVRRANSLKRLGSNSGTLSSDSADSVNNQAEVASQHASTVGTAGSKASKSMTALNNAVRHATDGFIGILDMFGFEDLKPSHLEHLCINLCAETMQHFYNTHIFKASIESCRDEGIHCDLEVDYVDNVPCIDLISSLRTGLLSMLDVECSVRGTVESYIQKLNTQHKQNPRLLDTNISKTTTELRSFGIQHYAGKVQYDATEFLETNRDILADDLVAVFHKHRCSFGFASHLFSSELKVLGAGGMEPSPRGISFRISPTSHTELLNGDEPVSTLTQDFHTRLDNLLRTLVHAKPHFIRCIKINQSEQPDLFDRHAVSKQLRAFQVLETVNLMAHGYPHRMRFKAFNGRYKSLAPFYQLNRTDDRAVEDSQLILDAFHTSIGGSCWSKEYLSQISVNWALGKRHIFLSEGARQRLESVRASTRNGAATILQSTWRGHRVRQRWPFLSQQNFHSKFKCPNENYPHQNSNNHNNPPPAPANPMSASAFLPPLIPPSSSTTTLSSVAMATITRHPLPTPPTAPASVQIHGPHPPKSSPPCQTPTLPKGSSAINPNGNNTHVNPGRINNSNNYVNDTGGSSSSRNSSPLVKNGHHQQNQSVSQSHNNVNNQLEPPPMSPYSNNSSSGASMVYSSVQNSGSSNSNHNGIHISTSNVISSSSKKDWTMSGGGFKDKGHEGSGGHPVPAPRAMVLHPSSVSSVTSTLHSILPPTVGGVLAQSPQGAGTTLQPNAPNSVCSSTNSNASGGGGRPPRPQPIAGTPPPDPGDKCDPKLVQQTCNLFGLDMERPPPLPPSRSYTVAGNTKLGYPQTRVMKMTYPDEGTNSEVRLLKGDTVTVIGTSPRRGHLMVEHKSRTLHVPFQYLELKPPASSTNPSATTATTTAE